MTAERRASAPRLIDWTGERCVPWSPDVQVVYEHYHRYLWAVELVTDRTVLDLGSGEGFGSAILARSAASVLGIDVDRAAVEHARLNYAAPQLNFRHGSALKLDDLKTGSFGAIVAFEVLDHLQDHERLLNGIRRLLARDGLLIMSTLDRRMYSDATGNVNPFHEKELDEDEFRSLLDARFGHVRLWGQRTIAGSRIGALDGDADVDTKPGPSMSLERAGGEWRVAGEPAPIYLIALASDAPLESPGAESYLSAYQLGLMRAAEEAAERRGAAAAAAETEQRGDAVRAELAAARAELDLLLGQLGARERELRASAEAIARAHQDVGADIARLRSIERSVIWQAFERTRRRFYAALGGRRSAPARLVQWTLRTAGRRVVPRVTSTPGDAAVRPIRMPRVEQPRVSIIVPVHARPDLTERCLRSIVEHTAGPPFEVIVVDDQAADHAAVWAALENARIIHHEVNQGYLRSNNLAAATARGEFLLLLNNDTEVRAGWLKAMVERAESGPQVAVVVPKLLSPDGLLQEAGGIVFNDGDGCNYGRGLDPNKPEFNYVREVDYGSAACMLVRTAVWRELEGFDERYLPMYYEDTDLCFAAREAGYSVLFEPCAEVLHVEGATAGTDITAGGKRFQEINRRKFSEKWAGRLAAEQPQKSSCVLRRASDRNRGPHVLVVDHRLPLPDRDSGSVRMWEMLAALRDLGCRVTFLPDDHLRWEPYCSNLQSIGVEVLYAPFSPEAEIASIGSGLALAIVSRPQVAARHVQLIREFSPAAKVVFDTVDLHFVREQRRSELDGGAVAAAAEAWRAIELAMVGVADVTATVSEADRREIRRQVPGTEVVVLPNANAPAARVPPPDERNGLLFVGSFEHKPNGDAVVWLANAIMPHVWEQLEGVTLSIVGPDPTPEVLALSRPGIEVLGWVADLQPLLDNSRVAVAPLRYGAGMKGKVTQSLACGVPVVTTSIGAEGLDAVDGRELLIADDAAGFAERVCRVYSDDVLWRELSVAGQALVERVCSPATLRERLQWLLAAVDQG